MCACEGVFSITPVVAHAHVPAQNLERVICNDIEPAAVESIRRNAALNGVDPAILVPNEGAGATVTICCRCRRRSVSHHSCVDPRCRRLHTHTHPMHFPGDANVVMHAHKGRPFDVVDLDPYVRLPPRVHDR